MAKTRNALKIIDRMVGRDPALRQLITEASINARVARMIRESRGKAGMTQHELAKRVGTTQSVIARLEDADYKGHSLSMLCRVAAALGRQIDIRLAPVKTRSSA